MKKGVMMARVAKKIVDENSQEWLLQQELYADGNPPPEKLECESCVHLEVCEYLWLHYEASVADCWARLNGSCVHFLEKEEE